MLSDFTFDEPRIPELAKHLWDTIGAQRDEQVYILLAFDEGHELVAGIAELGAGHVGLSKEKGAQWVLIRHV